MKKYKILISVILAVANLLGICAVSQAEEADYVVAINSNATEYVYKAWSGSSFNENYAILRPANNDGCIDIQQLYLELEGAYTISIVAGTAGEHNWKVDVLGITSAELNSKTYPASGTYNKFVEEKIGVYEFSKNEYAFSLRVYNDAAYIKEIRFTKTSAPIVESVTVNTGEFGETVSAGADSFSMVFNNEMADDNSGKITISSSEKELKTEYHIDGEEVTLNLLESMENGKEYTITVDGLTDAYGFKMANPVSYVFTAVDDGNGTASIEIENTSCDGLMVDVSGAVYSSADKGIKNRTVKAVFNDEEMAAVVSGEDGAFKLSFSLPEDIESGQHTIDIKSDYASDKTVNVEYYTQAYEETFLGELEGTTTYQEAQTVLGDNAAVLGLDITNDTRLLKKKQFYTHFIGKNDLDSVFELKEFYYKMVYLETINQAKTIANMKPLFESQEKSSKLGIDYNYYRVINSDAFLEKVLDWEVFETPEDLISAYNQLADAEIEEMFGLCDITIEPSIESVYVGQKAELVLKNTVTDAKVYKICVEAKFDKSFEPEFVSDFDYELSETDDGYKVIFDLSDEGVTEGDLGQFEFLGTATGTYSGTLEGNVYYKVDEDWDKLFEYSIVDKLFDITVNSKSSGGNGSSAGTVSTTRPKNNNTSRPSSPSIPIIPVNPPVENKFKFTDIESVSWAHESIYGLLEKNIISENSAKEFRPNDSITRAEFIKLLVVATGIYDENAKAEMNDVSESKWYYNHIASAVLGGIITGDEDKNINPEDFISRQDMAVVAFRAFGYDALYENEEFADDNEISEYAKSAVYTLRAKGVVNGRGENLYAPRENVTRAEAAKIIFNLIPIAE